MKCNHPLDYEDRFFKNQCPICGSSQGFDKEDYDWYGLPSRRKEW